jgi:hypothetical protein
MDLNTKQIRAAQDIVTKATELSPSVESFVHIQGAVGSGRTRLLNLAKTYFVEQGLAPIYLPNEQSEFESGAAALSKLIDAIYLDDATKLNLDWYKDPKVSWTQKFSSACNIVNHSADRYVLLCDEPMLWSRLDQAIAEPADGESQQFADWLIHGAKCRRVITGSIPNGVERKHVIRSPKLSTVDEVLEAMYPLPWKCVLTDLIANQQSRVSSYRAVMEVRLASACAWLYESRSVRFDFDQIEGVNALLSIFLDGIERRCECDSQLMSLCKALSKMAIGRTRWTEELLRSSCQELDNHLLLLIKHTLCEDPDAEFALHPLVRYEVIRRSKDHENPDRAKIWRLQRAEQEQVHRQFLRKLSAVTAQPLLSTDIEYLSHWALSGENAVATDNVRIHFVEQLHEIGYTLSYRYRQHHRAVEVYRVAIEFDPSNARSHHYYAFNLDWLAEKPELVESHYQKAIELRDDHPWYHSRWISYLVTRGQNKKAWDAWRDATDSLSVSYDSPDYIFLSLHRWVARWMLHWDELGMAERVLKSIKPELRDEGSICRLFDLLATLRLAEEGIAVFPLSVAKSDWWRPEGHTNLPLEIDGTRLAWYPARVEEKSDGMVYLMKGVPNQASPRGFEVEEIELKIDELTTIATNFAESDLEEGRYLELGYYGELGLIKSAIHTSLHINDTRLLPLVPPPDRWYRRSVGLFGKSE